MSDAESKKEQLLQRIKESIAKAESRTSKLRKTNTRLMIGGLVGSTISVVVAGGTAAQGPVVLSGIEGWRFACIIAAIVSLISAVCVGLIQQMKLGEKIPRGLLCVGQLKALDLALSVSDAGVDEVVKKYQGILTEYAEIIT